ncbi:MAG: MarR family winged helix-turn-helix transcriptional regulator [Aliishimia sp.]
MTKDPAALFDVFNEIGIIDQLTTARLEAQLPAGMIAAHFAVINHLIRVGEGTTPQRMARAFQIPKTSLTHTLQVLEKRGLIEMRPNPDDGRSKTVWLTPAGRALRGETIGKLVAASSELFEQFDVARLIEIKPVLEDLRKFLDKARDS